MARIIVGVLLALQAGAAAFQAHSVTAARTTVFTSERSQPCTCLELPPAGVLVTIASGAAILLRPESALWGLFEGDPDPSDEAKYLTSILCRPEGWDLSMEMDGGAEISISLAFENDERFRAYPQGTATLLRPSKFISSQAAALWSVDVADEDEGFMPRAIEVCLPCDGIEAGDVRVPAGPIYLNADLQLDERATLVAQLTSGRADGNAVIRLSEGTVVMKQYAGLLGAATGLSELKKIGSFEARPATPAARTPSPPIAPPPSPPPAPPLTLSSAAPTQTPTLFTSLTAPKVWSIGRRGMLAAAVAASPMAAMAADLSSLANQPLGGGSGTTPAMRILSAQADVKQLLDDEDTFRTMVIIGLPTTSLPLPPNLPFALFRQLESRVTDPDVFMDGAIEYVEYARDANDLLELARLARTNGGGPPAIRDYVERAIVAAKGARRALDRMVPLLPM